MPSQPFDTAIATTINYRGPKTWQQIYESLPFFGWIKDKNGIYVWEGGGDKIETNIETRPNNTFGAADHKQAQVLKEQNPLQTVSVGCKFIDGNITWYDFDETANVGPFKVKDFIKTLYDSAESSAMQAIAMEIWQDGTGVHLDGLPAILGYDNTYMGIDRSVAANAYWRPKSGTAFTMSVDYGNGNVVSRSFGPYNTAIGLTLEGDESLGSIYNDCCDNGGTDAPDFGCTSEKLYRKLVAMAKAQSMDVRNERMSQLGFPENLQYRNAAIVWDRNCGAVAGTPDDTTLILLNSKYIKLRPYAGYDSTFKATPVTPLYGDGVQGKTRLMRWCGNLQAIKPQRLGMLTNKS